MTEFTHINQQGHARMADVLNRQITKRTAVAHSSIAVNRTIYKQISDDTNARGNVLNTAQIAGIMAARNTSTIIPMYRPLPLTGIDVRFNWDETNTPLYALNIQATVSTTGKIGAEMKALTATSAATLITYDMTKTVDKGMIIGETHLESKSDGKSGGFQHQLDQ